MLRQPEIFGQLRQAHWWVTIQSIVVVNRVIQKVATRDVVLNAGGALLDLIR